MEANKTIFLEDESPTLRQFNKFLRASRYTMMFVLEHWYQFCTVIVKIKNKYGLLSNHLFQRKQEHGGWKEPQENDRLL